MSVVDQIILVHDVDSKLFDQQSTFTSYTKGYILISYTHKIYLNSTLKKTFIILIKYMYNGLDVGI